MLRESERGIGDSDILPGVIKIASLCPNLLLCEVRALTAAGKAQKITGLPLCVHSATGTRYQQYLIEAAGANMEKVYFSHMESPTNRENRTPDMQIDYIADTINRGSYVSFNGFGHPAYLAVDDLAALVKGVIDRGCAGKILLSLDFYWTYQDGKRRFAYDEVASYVSQRTYPFLMTYVLPWLKEIRVSDGDIACMIHENAQALFS